jgi:chromosome partitioning protein
MKQRSIVLASLKGGVSKTTVAANLAAYWARLPEQVLLVDADPNRSVTRLCTRSNGTLLGEAGRCVGIEEVTAETTYERLVLDTAGGIASQQANYAADSSFVILPTLCTMASLEMVAALAPIIRETGSPFAALLTQVDERRKSDEVNARNGLKLAGIPTLKARTTYLSAWIKAEAAGAPVLEAKTDSGRPDPKAPRAWQEVKAIAQEVDLLINQSSD